MKAFLLIASFVLVCSRSVTEEESVVSVYTTHATAAGTAPQLDVYRQIADNIADRITQPIYRFFGFTNKTEEKTTKRPFEHIELDSTEVSSPTKTNHNSSTDVKSNEITPERDVEEISINTKQSDKKPEKITLFNSYLPVKEKFEFNNTRDVNDNSLELDDVEPDDIDQDEDKGRGGPFVYLLELVGSIIQLLWGGFLTIFKPASSS